MPTPLPQLRHRLVVSVQADPGSPLRDSRIMAAMAQTVLLGGAAGLRMRGADDVRAARAVTGAPIIGLTKTDRPDTEVYITPTPDEVRGLAAAGADVVAFDATLRPRPHSAQELIQACRAAGVLAMADISTLEEARQAHDLGADFISTTMSGYTPHSPQQAGPDWALMQALSAAGIPYVAEGRLKTPEEAARALSLGAEFVVVGSAITRPDHVTRWFVAGLGPVE